MLATCSTPRTDLQLKKKSAIAAKAKANQRGVLALRMKPIMKERAEAKRLDGNARGGKSSQISDATIDAPIEKFRADEAVSELANVSHDPTTRAQIQPGEEGAVQPPRE